MTQDQRLEDEDISNPETRGQIHVSPERRTIFMEGALSEQTCFPVIKTLYDFAFTPGPIALWIYSYGGDLDATYALYDTMQIVRKLNPITTVAVGSIASAATVLLLGGSTRLSLDSTNFMVHSIEYSFTGAPQAGKSFHNMVNRSQDKYFSLLSKNTLKTKEFWKKQIKDNKEYWFGAREAKTYGLIDGVLDNKQFDSMLKNNGPSVKMQTVQKPVKE